jgi:hypothetical protein
MSKLIPPERCSLRPYWTRSWGPFQHAGVIVLSPPVELPEWDTWSQVPYNRLHHISTNGYVDGVEQLSIIPVKINTAPCEWMFDTELGDRYEINRANPAIAFFMGNDDWHYGLRFPTFEERDKMLAEFGEELGFFPLQGHN